MVSFSQNGTAYDLTGPENANVVVLIHGLGLCREMWAEHCPLLEKEYRVLNYDLYGHGQSGPTPRSASLKVFAEQLAELMDECSIGQASVIGFSIGGMINRRFVMDYPSRVKSLVILNSPHDRGAEAQNQVEQRALKVREQGAMATMDDALKRWFSPDYLASGKHVQSVRNWRENVDPESYAQAAWVLANGVRELIDPEVPVAVPTFIVTSENDSGSTPDMSRSISNEISGSEVKIVPQLRHLGVLEQPMEFMSPTLQFLKELDNE